jgi:hypothetical protein
MPGTAIAVLWLQVRMFGGILTPGNILTAMHDMKYFLVSCRLAGKPRSFHYSSGQRARYVISREASSNCRIVGMLETATAGANHLDFHSSCI